MSVEIEETERGFEVVRFEDANHRGASLQQSSAVGPYEDAWERPGTSFVWLGQGEERMHLCREHVAELVKLLSAWMTTGSFGGASKEDDGA